MKLKQNPISFYIQMCYAFLKFKNPQAANIILANLIQKGYKLEDKDLLFYLYVSLYNLFIYGLNVSK
jgi:hypothetical protein